MTQRSKAQTARSDKEKKKKKKNPMQKKEN